MNAISMFMKNSAIIKAEADYQEAICKCLTNEITLDECLNFQLAVFEACKNNPILFKINKSTESKTK